MKCHICHRPTSDFRDEKSNIKYYYCRECAYFFKDPTTYQSMAVQKERYDLHENDVDNPGYRAYFERFLSFVLPLTGKPRTALDFGCGRSKLLASLLNDHGILCDSYDPIYYPEGLNNSKKYDFIVTTEVFEHLHQPGEVFEALLGRVVQGGYLAIQTQFHPNNIENFKKWYYHQDPTHIVFFHPKTFNILCKIHGCDYVEDNGKNMVVIRKPLLLG